MSNKECGFRKSKDHPLVYTKDELVQLATEKGMSKSQAMKKK